MLLLEWPIARAGRADDIVDCPAIPAREQSSGRATCQSLQGALMQRTIQLDDEASSAVAMWFLGHRNFCQDQSPLMLYDAATTAIHQGDIMSSVTSDTVSTMSDVNSTVLGRIAREGYGPGAWHGPDLKAALGDVKPKMAFQRPAPGRHNIAEIALHHAYFVRSVRAQLSGITPEPFVLEGDEWFEVADDSRLTWRQILAVVESEQRQLADAIADLGRGRARPAANVQPFDLVLGITCHAVYHAGQVQLVKRLLQG
jgi:hypothetical protein